MTDNLFEAQYDVTKKTKIKRFYESNKILIFSSVFSLIILFGVYSFYLHSKEKKRILLSQNYIQAKIYLENNKKNKAKNLLEDIIFANDPSYSTLSLFLILSQKLVSDQKEVSKLFEHVLMNNKFEKEVKNLLIYKKAIYNSNFLEESALIEDLKPVLSEKSIWRPHALLLLGDYFASKKQYIKAKEFYKRIFLIKNLQRDLYEQARSQLALIAND